MQHLRLSALILIAAMMTTGSAVADETPNTRLAEWERGVSVASTTSPNMKMYLWFYEWHMFGAVSPQQHTRGAWSNKVAVSKDQLKSEVVSSNPGIRLNVQAVNDGAKMTLNVTNRSQHDWPKLAAMIACFNPGPAERRNKQFANTKTYFHSGKGLMPLAISAPREIHFNNKLRAAIDREANDMNRYVWSSKWPKSKIDAVDGLIIRESTKGDWVTGIAWDRFVSAQGHNPWECMHLSVNVGPLKRGETRTVLGRIYLLRGKKEELLKRYQADFRRKPESNGKDSVKK